MSDKTVQNSRKNFRARQVGDLVSGTINEVIMRRSGMTLDLIGAWEDIVGAEFVDCTWPEKILWPRNSGDANAENAVQAGTLIIACEGAKAVFLQHQNQEIISRLNRFFGFQAIKRVKIIQKPIPKTPAKQARPAPLDEIEQDQLDKVLERIADPELKKRIEALGRGVITRNRKKNKA